MLLDSTACSPTIRPPFRWNRETMHILILSRKATLYSTRRLIETARARGHEVSVVDPLEFSLVVTRARPSL